MDFRAAFFSSHYEASLDFYCERLRLAVVDAWDRGPDDRGTVFAAGAGRIEVLARPRTGEVEVSWDGRSPQGVTLVVEVDDVEAVYAAAVRYSLPIRTPLTDQPWGHRSFQVEDPDGVVLYLFAPIDGGDR